MKPKVENWDYKYPHNSPSQYVIVNYYGFNYSADYHLLTTGFTGFPLNGEKGNWYAEALILIDHPSAQRTGGGVYNLANSLRKLGVPCEIEKLGSSIPDQYKGLPIINSVTGNY